MDCNRGKTLPFRSIPVLLTGTIVPLLAAAYFWILPLARPHGIFGWGHYRFRDILFDPDGYNRHRHWSSRSPRPA